MKADLLCIASLMMGLSPVQQEHVSKMYTHMAKENYYNREKLIHELILSISGPAITDYSYKEHEDSFDQAVYNYLKEVDTE